MKVVLLAPTPPPAGGIAGWTERMMKASLKHGWKVEVVDEKQLGTRELFSSNKIKRNFGDEWKRCKRIWNDLKIALSDTEVKVVHSCIPSTTFAMMREYVCACITHKRKRKFIIHFRCTLPNTTKGKLGIIMLRKLCNKSDFIMVLNKQSEDFAKSLTKTPIEVVPNFVDVAEAESSFEVREVINKVIYVGGVIETKGALEAFELADYFPGIKFEFVGDVPEENRVLAAKHKNVVLTGALPHSDVKERLLGADVFLFPTHFYGEGFSNALCEAMAVGLPCLVTDWAANADMIDDGEGGYVVPIHAVDKAVEALRKMLDKSVRVQMSAQNMKKVREEYSQKTVTDKYVDIYEQLTQE